MKQQFFTRCLKCNRKLTTLRARQRGYGDCCWRKHLQEEKTNHKTVFDILKEQSS